MTDMSKHIEPKSDQLNADDLIAGPRTITITRVKETGNKEQPISIYFEGDNNRPWKPNKGMRRLLVGMWTKEGDKYVGQSVTLFRDPEVLWGGEAVGGIRVSHASGLTEPFKMALSASAKKRVQYVVMPLRVQPQQQQMSVENARSSLTAVALPGNSAGLQEQWQKIGAENRKALADELDGFKAKCQVTGDQQQEAREPQQGDDDYAGV